MEPLSVSIFSGTWPSYGSTHITRQNPETVQENSAENEPKQVTKLALKDRILRLFNLGLVGLVIVGFGMCGSLFAPFFPTEAARRGVSATTVGLIFGAFTVVMFIGSVASGLMVRILGLQFMIWAGTLIAGGSTVLFGLLDQAPPGNYYVALCFIVRLVEGAGASMYNTAAYSLVAELYPQNIAINYAVLEASAGVGRMVGPTMGGVLYKAGGFSLPFYVVGAMLLVFGFISMGLLHYTMSPSNDDKNRQDSQTVTATTSNNANQKKGDRTSLPWTHFYRVSYESWTLTITLASGSILIGYPQPTLALYFEQLGLTDAVTVGFIFLGGTVAYTIISVISGKLADTYPKWVYHMMTLGGILVGLGFIVMGPVPFLQPIFKPSITLTTIGFVICSIGISMIINPAPSAIIDAARAAGYQDGLDLSVMVATLFNAMWFLGSFAGAPVAGFLMDMIGFAWGAFIMAIIAFIASLILVLGACSHKVEAMKVRRLYDYSLFFNAANETTSIECSQVIAND